MHEFVYNLGILSLTITFFYIVFWFDRRSKPSEFHLIRNHLQRISHPHLTVSGYGNYFIEYKRDNLHFFEYFNSLNTYRKNLEDMQKYNSIKFINHGVVGYKAWEKWGK